MPRTITSRSSFESLRPLDKVPSESEKWTVTAADTLPWRRTNCHKPTLLFQLTRE